MEKRALTLLAISFILLFAFEAQAVVRTWSGAGNWNVAGNWTPAGVPGAADDAVFDGTSTANCAINAAVNVRSISINAGYTGTVSQNGFTINSSGDGTGGNAIEAFVIAAGTFTGGTARIELNDDFTQTGGTFTSTSDIMHILVAGSTTNTFEFNRTAGTFNHNNGTIHFENAGFNVVSANFDYDFDIDVNTDFNNLIFEDDTKGTDFNFDFAAAITVQTVPGSILTSAGSFPIRWEDVTTPDELEIKGDIEVRNTALGRAQGGTAYFTMNHTAAQSVTSFVARYRGGLPNFNVDKPSGLLTYTGFVDFKGADFYRHLRGLVNTDNATVIFNGAGMEIGGNDFKYKIVDINDGTYPTPVHQFPAGFTMSVSDTLFFTGSGQVQWGSGANTGTVRPLDVFIITNTAAFLNAADGTATILFDSTTNQQMWGNTLIKRAELPNVTFNKTGGQVDMHGNITVGGSWIHTSGPLLPNASEVAFSSDNTITGDHRLNKARLMRINNVTAGTDVKVTSDMIFDIQFEQLNVGNFHAQGDLYVESNITTGVAGGTGFVIIDSNQVQDFFGEAVIDQGFLPNITVNKTGGSLTLHDNLSVRGAWEYIAGTVTALNTSRVAFYFNPLQANRFIDGEGAGTMAFYDIYIDDAHLRPMQGDVRVTNTCQLNDGFLQLRDHTLFMENSSTAAFTRGTGFVESEDTLVDYGYIDWFIDNTGPGNIYEYPFGRFGNGSTLPANAYVPAILNIQAAGVPSGTGSVAIATYTTRPAPIPNNRPLPQTVTNTQSIIGADNSCNFVDRYWLVECNNYTTEPTVNYTYTYTDDEWNIASNCIANENDLEVQIWDPVGQQWDLRAATINAPANQATYGPTDSCGIFVVATATLPDVPISSSDSSLCLGDCISFSEIGATTPNSWAWTFQGGTPGSSNVQNPTNICYNTVGTFDVTLVATFTNGSITTTYTDFITVTNAPTASGTQDNVGCFGDSTGSINVTQTPPGVYTYNWNPVPPAVQGAQNQVNLPAGSYSVTVEDVSGCADTVSFTITEPPVLDVNITGTSALQCFNECIGTLTANPTGGTAGYNYAWNTGATTQTINSLCAGTYRVTVTDAEGCTAADTVTITQPTQLQATLFDTTNISCGGTCDGGAVITVTGGTGAYTFTWTGGVPGPQVNDSVVTGLCIGSYSVQIQDANGCDTTINVTLTAAPPVSPNLDATVDVLCFGDSTATATVSATGGQAPYDFIWPAPSGTGTVNHPSVSTGTGYPIGTYTVTVTDAAGCDTTIDFTISQPTLLTVSIGSITNVTCSGASDGSAIATASGGNNTSYTYSWTPANAGANITGLPAGQFSVTVTDANNCTAADTANITAPTPLLVTTDTVVDVECFGDSTGSITVSATGATGPYTISWPAPSATGVVISTTSTGTAYPAGNYNVTVTDATGNCDTIINITVGQSALLTGTIVNTPLLCGGDSTGTATVTPTGGNPGYTYQWNPQPPTMVGATTPAVTGLPAGTYTVLVTDANNCDTTFTTTITGPTPVTGTLNLYNIPCAGDSSGSARVFPSGGTGGSYTITWAGGPFTPIAPGDTVTDLIAGNYTVNIEDGNGCDTTLSFTLFEPPLLTATIGGVSDVLCNGDTNGVATVTPAGGTPSYTYLWDNGETTATATALPPGNQCVTVTDANGCDTVVCVLINEPPAIVITLDTIIDLECNGVCDGEIQISITGGVPTIQYAWSNGANTEDIAGLCAGTYSVTVSDANGCSAADTFTVVEPPALVATITDSTDVLCNGDTTGTAEVTATGGTPPYTYTWGAGTPGPGGNTVTLLPAGTWCVTVTDANLCADTVCVTINEPPALVITLDSATNLTCNAVCDGAIDITVTGGTAGYTYLWSNTATTQDLSGLCAGTYSLVVTDANGCVDSIVGIVITEPGPVIATVDSVQNVGCNGDSTGNGFITMTGGTLPFTFQWDDPDNQTVEDPINLPAGTWTVIATDSNGCADTVALTITEPPALVLTIDSVGNVLCNGDNTGRIEMSGSGGTPPYTYVPAQIVGNLTAGDYIVSVTDSNGCTVSDTITITEPPLLTSTTTQTDVACNGDSTGIATVIPAGGTSPYTYLWSNGGVTASINTLPAGQYEVTVTDSLLCETFDTVIITEPTPLTTTTSINDLLCFGDTNATATVTPSGGTPGYTYLWSDGQTDSTAINLVDGQYEVTVTDANGCQAFDTVIITEPTLLVAQVDSFINVACNGDSTGSIFVSATGGTPFSGPVPYTISPSQLINVPAGTYAITITDSNGCVVIDSVTITEPPVLALSIDSTVNVDCNGNSTGEYFLSASGGTPPYVFGPSGATVNGLPAGSYPVTVTDSLGCVTFDTVIITEPTLLVATITDSVDILCNGDSTGSATVTPTGGTPGYTYLWSDGQVTAIAVNLPAGQHSVIVTDTNGCEAFDTVTLVEPTLLTVSITDTTDLLCFNECIGSATVTPVGGTPGYTFLWSDGQTDSTATNLCAGTFSVIVTDANGCQAFDTITITEPTQLVATITDSTDVLCGGDSTGTAVVTATGGTPGYTYAWSIGTPLGAGDTITNLPAGTWCVTVTDANGCADTVCVIISEPAILVATITDSLNVACFGDSTGTATVTPTGGTPGYQYLWSDGQTNAMAVNLPIGTYSVIVTDTNGCQAFDTLTITEPPLLTTTTSITDLACFGDTNGTATVIPAGGTPGYSYGWSDGQTTQTAINLTAGQYEVTVTDTLGCEAFDTITITEPTQIVITIDSTVDVLCNGDSTGAGFISVTGGTDSLGLYNYLWSDGQTVEDPVNLPAGTWTVVVTDSNGCTVTDSITITEPPLLVVSFLDTFDVGCFGDSTGAIVAQGVGGTPPYAYAWPAGVGNPTLLGDTIRQLPAGTFAVTITDSNGCVATDSVTITQPTELIVDITDSTNILCNGDSTGTATVTPTGGTPGPGGYNYLWNTTPPQTDSTATSLPAGTFVVTVTDANGCVTIDSVTLTEPPLLTVSITDTVDLLCFNECIGSATVTPAGGTAPYTYLWNDGQTDSTAINLCADTFTVVVTDANGCEAFDTIIIIEPTLLGASITDTTNVLCFGDSTGSATVTPTGGTPAYTYLWPDGQTDSTAINLPAGTYCVTVTDANACDTIVCITITEPPLLSGTLSVDSVLCNGDANGVMSVTPIGGTPPYVLTWNGGTQTGANGDSIINLIAGVYCVTITDANLCDTVLCDTVFEPALLVATITDTFNVACNSDSTGGSVVAVTGGTAPYSYNWDAGVSVGTGVNTDTIFQLPAGTWSVTVTDANGCADTVSVTITEPPVLTSSITDTVDLLCNGICTGSATVTPAGGTPGYTYLWSDGQTDSTAINLCAGSYFVVVTDANGCTDSAFVTIIEPLPITLVTDSTNVSCFGGSDGTAWVTASGGTPGYTYAWADLTTATVISTTDTAFNLAAGPYAVVVTDTNGCMDTALVVITEPAAIAIAPDSVNISCHGANDGMAWVTITGGTAPYTYNWSAGTPVGANGDTTTLLTPGLVSVTVTDANGCLDSVTISISQPTPLGLTMDSTNVTCFGFCDGTATANPTGGTPPYIYAWSNGGSTQTITTLCAGLYTVTVTDANGCDTSLFVNVTQPTPLTSAITNSVNASCFGFCDGSATVTPQGGTTPYTYLWNNGSTDSTATGLCAGNYVAVVTDANGCVDSSAVTITEPSPLALTIAVDSNTNCNGGTTGGLTVCLTGGTPPYTYSWSHGPVTSGSIALCNSVAGLGVGSYTVTITDTNGCSLTIDTTIIERPGPQQTGATVIIPATCAQENGSATVNFTTADPPLNYTWSDPLGQTSATAIALAPGTYTVTVGDNADCDTIFNVTIPEIDNLDIADVDIKDEFCDNDDGRIIVTVGAGSPPFTYSWSHDTLLAGPTADGLDEGTYSVLVRDSIGCDTLITVTLTNVPPPILDADPQAPQTIFPGQTVDVEILETTGIPSMVYTWGNASDISCDSCAITSLFPERTRTYTVLGTDSTTGCMDTLLYTVIVRDENNIFIPNAITPNGDGVNDLWIIRELESFPDNEMIIFNRWGDEIFTASPYNNDWGGTYNGSLLPEGTYYYILKLNDIEAVIKDNITVIR